MKSRLLLLLFFICLTMAVQAQVVPGTYWVQLKDKKGTPYQISHPEAFLSQRSIDRRTRQQIPIDETDLPVSPGYLDNLKALGAEVVHTSKWLNGATVRVTDSVMIKSIEGLPFVQSVQLTKPSLITKSTRIKFNEDELNSDIPAVNYGNAYNQLTQLNGQYLHNKGYRGKGIQIAVIDAGFWHVNQIAAFDSLRTSNRILGTRDFVDPTSDIYLQHSHGMSVLSTMGGNIPETLIGTAPDASFYLFRSEDASTEYPIEEDNWVAAAELADSLGVDEINSSLGYNIFDDPQMSHPYSDMNGKKTRVTQGANMAFEKGILVFTSAGNEGGNVWQHIIAPSDGVNVLAVGAVDMLGIRASFSSVGPAFGGAIKPNVVAQGALTYLINSTGIPGYSSGTSFSSPVLAGMGACLLQANPGANVRQIKRAIEQSAHQYNDPDSLLGYGIPDFQKADLLLKSTGVKTMPAGLIWEVMPNPFSDILYIRKLDTLKLEGCRVSIYSLQGTNLWEKTFTNSEIIILKNLGFLPKGFLILTIRSGGKKEEFKLIKIAR
ncbi:MAG TPA: hypothetical protein DCL77_18795 [Prolixibacteraceae bacterium]|jgi:hypothetical protein|nr:hypothetical protein [Prolixibacteraceae bacterium]